ncbi:MAG: hypothetical protein M1838_000194 [Thelocarpon superellum]|nr:MAG: hypothetical protein M1838_000194 [Thelocarpon superellum]
MPFKPSFLKNNRSQVSLLSQDRPGSSLSITASPLPSPGLPSRSTSNFGQLASSQHPQTAINPEQDPYYHHPLPLHPADDDPHNYYRQPPPPPPHGHHHSQSFSGFAHPAPLEELSGGIARQGDTGADDPRPSYSAETSDASPLVEPKKSKRSFFGFGPSLSRESRRAPTPAPDSAPTSPTTSPQGNTAGLGRRISLRRKDPPLSLRQSRLSPVEQPAPQNWPTSGHPDPYLPPAPEEDEGDPASIHSARPQQGHSADLPPLPPEHDGIPGSTDAQHLDSGDHRLEHRRTGEAELAPPPRLQSLNPIHLHPESLQHMQQNAAYTAYQPSHGDTPTTGRLSPEDHRRLGQSAQAAYQQTAQQEALNLSRPPQQQQQQQSQQPQQQQQQQQQAQYQAYVAQQQNQGGRLAPQHGGHSRQGSMAPLPGDSGRAADGNLQSGHGASAREPGSGSQLAPGGQVPSQPPTPGRSQFGSAPPGAVQQGQLGRGVTAQSQGSGQQNVADHDRTSPQPSRSKDDLPPVDGGVHQELQGKYSKVKKLYFDKLAQVEQLQNTLAHQRLSQSRTSLDDNEYATRFNRLDGAINNLAFNIRKEWGSVPPWLQPVINRDAHIKGTKEMTVVGRACISRWIVEEILDRYFHPGLEPGLSSQLKIIEKNIRRLAPPAQSLEEEDALLAKVSNWRLTTADGLQDALATSKAADYRAKLTQSLVRSLIASLTMMLNDPPPSDLEGGVAMIVELAVGLAANVPLESRDVFFSYPSPGTPIMSDTMKLETGLPPLATSVGEGEGSEADRTSLSGVEVSSQMSDGKDQHSLSELRDSDSASLKEQVPKKRGMLGGFLGKKPGPTSSLEGMQKAGGASGSQNSLTQQTLPPGQRPTSPAERKDEVPRVRVAAFMTVEVRGRSVLVKAPVWAL